VDAFRETCGFPREKPTSKWRSLFEQMMNVDEGDENKESGPAITAGRVKQRFHSIDAVAPHFFIKYSETEISEYFFVSPRDGETFPRGWTNQMEFVYLLPRNLNPRMGSLRRNPQTADLLLWTPG
jgi:hypothetical protein